MKISDELIEGIYTHAKESGHPDPLGYVARMEIESGFDPDKEGKDGEVGLNQIAPKRASSLGLNDIESIEGNVDAAIQIDFHHFEKVQQNIEKMFTAWKTGLAGKKLNNPPASVNKWLKQIESGRKKLAKILNIDIPVIETKSKSEKAIERETSNIYSGDAFIKEGVADSTINREIALFFPEAAESQLGTELVTQGNGSTLVANNSPLQTSSTERLVNMIIQFMDKI